MTGRHHRNAQFNNVDGVTFPGGLGPVFNLNSCGGCHAFPTTGCSSPPTNPHIAVATLLGAKNTIPSFMTANNPVREVRFMKNPDGGVHDLFTITGRSDAPSGCTIAQPNFAAAVAANNAIFRIPTPTYGLGLVENVPDAGLQAAVSAVTQQRASRSEAVRQSAPLAAAAKQNPRSRYHQDAPHFWRSSEFDQASSAVRPTSVILMRTISIPLTTSRYIVARPSWRRPAIKARSNPRARTRTSGSSVMPSGKLASNTSTPPCSHLTLGSPEDAVHMAVSESFVVDPRRHRL
jgi:hypothetical protein